MSLAPDPKPLRHEDDPAIGNAAAVPAHVAIIMDGNGRWAKERGLPRAVGHRQGAEAVRRAVKAAAKSGIAYLTLFGFSSENWQRPRTEIEDLMALLRLYLQREIRELHAAGIRLKVIGERARLAPDIVDLIAGGEAMTAENRGLTLTIALSYGGREEILRATRAMAQALAEGRSAPESLSEAGFGAFLDTAGMPDPDLVIRTGGEKRLSNFLLWQSAYAELFFLDTHWPDFDAADLDLALAEFARRSRRYGRLG